MYPRQYRRSTRWRQLRHRLARGVVITLLATFAMAFTCGQASAAGATLDPLPLPSLSGLASWLRGNKAPHWGHLPHQSSGTAAGRGHDASASSTRAGHGVGSKPEPGKGELPSYAPSNLKAAKGRSAGSQGFDARTSKRVASKSTATSDYFENADGSHTQKLAPTPINFRDGDGNWQHIDTTMRKESDGRLHQGANSVAVDLAPRAADPALVRVAPDSRHALSYGLQGAAAVQPDVSGSTTRYRQVLPDTDLVLQSGAVGLKESLVLHSARAANEWTFPLDTQGLHPVLADDGSVKLLDADGKASVVIPAGYAFDSRTDRVSGEHATTHAVTYRLVESGGRTSLRMTLDTSWLHARERVFPVTVDPSMMNWGALTTYAESGEPGDHSMEQTMKVGSWDSGPHSAVSYLQFPALAQSLDNSRASVTAAELDLSAIWSSTCTPERFDVAPVTKAWSPQQITGYPGPSYGSSIGNLTPNVPVSCANKSGDLSKSDYLKVPLSTGVFNNWAGGSSGDFGLAVYASTSDNLHWKQFGAAYNPDASPNLFLTTGTALPPYVVSTTPANNAAVNSLTPQLTAVAQWDTALMTSVKYDFQVYDTGGTKLADSGLITGNSYNVPAGKLKWGQSYYWGVQAYDGTNYSAGPNWQQLTTQVPQPVVTSGLSQNPDGHGHSPAIGNYTTSATDANVSAPGPSLTVTRDYNSRDPRTAGAFGAGWSSVFDARVAEQYDASGAVVSAQVTYPDGSAVGYGKNTDGSFSPPQGRFATFRSISGGYSLTDKNATVYAFTQSLGSGKYGLTSITDANGRAENFTWSSGHITDMTSAVSGRALHLTWSTPSGATGPHVATIATDPAVAGQSSTASTWTYSYNSDQLTKVCSPVDTNGCAQYGYTAGSQYHNQTLDQGPVSYWPLTESSGKTAASAVLARAGADNATYSNVTLGRPGPLAGSSATAADFDGSSSYVKLPNLGLGASSAQSVSLWFKTSTAAAGVLFSASDKALQSSTTKDDALPALYMGNDGKLKGLYWYGTENPSPISTTGSVADGKWHHVVLTGSWTTQQMWLDGGLVGSAPGAGKVGLDGTALWLYSSVYLGAGYLGAGWPDQPHPNSATLYATYFKGSLSNVSFYDKPLAQDSVSDLYQAGTKSAGLLTSVTRPSGKTYASVSYDPVTTAVTQLTDSNGGSWTMGAPTVSGSSQIYRASALGSGPAAYYRFGEAAGAGQAVNEVNSGAATYNGVTLGSDGPFTDNTAAAFDGKSSFVQLPTNQQVQTGPNSVEMWFKTPPGNTAGGVLYGEMGVPLNAPDPASSDWTPALYVGTDGKLHGKFWDTNGVAGGMTSSALVNDGKWHHVLLSGSSKGQHLYLDGVQAGSTTAALRGSAAGYNYIGAGESTGTWPAHPTNTLGYFSGSIAEAAFYRTELTGQDAAAHWSAGRSSNGLSPLKTVKVTDPGTKTITYQYDLWNGNREVAQTDGRGYRTTYGYDTGGFLHTVTDPNGNVVTSGHDVRGNEVSRTTCQNQAGQACSTTYTSYLPDDTSAQLSPNPQNDLPATVRDGRSSSATDNTYLTSYSYDAAGNKTGVTTPPVPGFPNGRTTAVTYTDGASVPAADGGYAPRGLPYKTVSPGGATTTVTYFKNGDVASTTDPNGLVSSFTYDNLGRPLTKKAVSDTFPNGLVTQYRYDAESQVVQQTDPAVTDRVTGAVHQAQTTTVYDADGLVTSQAVADLSGGDASRTVKSTYNQYNQLATNTDATNATTTLTYDAYGNKATERDPLGNTIVYTYDANGHLLTQTLQAYTGDPVSPSMAKDLVESSRAYDPAGRLQSITDAMGNTTSYTYTDNGLTTSVTRADPSGKNTFVQQANTYDAAGNLTQQVTNNGATVATSTVDAADRVTATTVDPAGVNRTTTVSYTPDDRVATSTLTDGSGTTHATSSTYDAMGNVTSRSVRQDGIGHPTGWWPLNQSSGSTVTDASGTGNTAAATAVTWNDGAASLNGTTSVIATNGPVLNTGSSYTVSAWVRLAAQGANDQTFVGQGGNNHQALYLGYTASAKAWSFATSTNDGSGTAYPAVFSPNGSAAAGAWTHLVATYEAGTGAMKLYVNGQPSGTATNSTPWSSAGPLTLGAVHTIGGALYNQANGSIGNVQTYSRPLTADEVSRLYAADRTGGATASGSQATTRWQLDKRGLPVSMTDPDNNVTNYVHDEAGHLTVTSAPAVNTETNGGPPALVHPTSTVGYNTFGDQAETQDPNGNTVTTAFDAAGRKRSQTLPNYTPPGSSAPIAGATTTWTYDDMGNVTQVTDPLQHTDQYVYDQLGDVAQVTDARKGVTHTVYDANGEALSVTTPSGGQTQATYDFMGRKLTTSVLDRFPNPVTSTTTHSYAASPANPGGAFLASTTTQNGVTTSYGYNHAGETTQVTDGAGNTTETTYDLEGHKVAVKLPDGTRNTVSYDQLGNPVQAQSLDTDGQTVLATRSATYSAAGQLMSSTDANQHTTTFTRDALGQVTGEVQPVDAAHSITTSFGYDAAGHRTRFTDGRGNARYYTFTSWNLPESVIEPAVSTSTYSYTSAADSTFTTSYDAAGRAVTQTAPGGVTVTSGYDALGNVTSQSGTGADAPTATRSFSYDADNRMLTAATSAVGTTIPSTSNTFTYNDRGQLLTANGTGGSSSFAYDGDGLTTSRTDAAGTTTYGYDKADRLSTLNDPATGTRLTYTYNSLSQPANVQYGGKDGNVRTFGYDSLHRLVSDSLKTTLGATVASIGYSYDTSGNLTGKTTTGLAGSSNNTYTYDWADRLTSWNNGSTTTAYAYDDSGNRIRIGSNVYTYDARDQLTSDGVNTYRYTARGTLTQQATGSTTTAFASDAFDQQVTQGTQSYVTDALGRVMTGTGTDGSKISFSYSGTVNTLASDGSSTYTWTPDGGLVGIGMAGAAAGTGSLALTDQHDDVVGNFSATGTALSGSTAYDPLGNGAGTTGTPVGRLGYQSGWTDLATGKVNMAARWYNPAAGQFMNRDTMSFDPVPDSATANPFAYVEDNPLKGTDPSGHGWWGSLKHAASSGWHHFTSWMSSGWHAVTNVWDSVSSWTSNTYHRASSWMSREYDDTMSSLRRELNRLDREIAQLNREIHDSYRYVRHRVSHVYHATTRAVSHVYHHTVHAVTTAYHATAKAVRTTTTYFKNHAAAIASFAVSTAVFIGCEAAVGAATGGVGAVVGAAGCGALAGAVGGAVNQGAKCMSGQAGGCSVSAFAGAAAMGAVGGAIGGALGGALGGKLAESALGSVLPKVVANSLEGASIGGLSGGSVGATDYGLSCSRSGAGCSWSGAAKAAASGAADGAIGGAVGGALASRAGCGRTHSFTASTRVAMADGSSKPIEQIKAGDQVRNAVPGKPGATEVHKVDKVIVTRTDHDFVDVSVAPTTKPSLKSRVLKQVVLGLASAATAIAALSPTAASATTITTTYHHPFYDQTQSAFVEAKDLHTGDLLETDNGTIEVTGVRQYHQDDVVTYDLTVDGLHTYYVLAGDAPVLVHNCGGSNPAHSPTCGCANGAQPRLSNGTLGSNPNGPAVHSRDTEYPSSYRTETHEHMVTNFTDEGRVAGGWPTRANGERIPRSELTWRDETGEEIPFGQLTYDHSPMVVEHWNMVGYDSPRSVRNDFFSETDGMTAMTRSANSSHGASSGLRYRQDTGPNYSR